MAIKTKIRSASPSFLISLYHFLFALLPPLFFFLPSRRITVIGVTGTKGKTSTTEFLNAIFEEAGYTTAVLNSIRIKTGSKEKRNLKRMSMPGRFGVQRFLSEAIDNDCTIAIIEMTSEGAAQHRHRFINLDCLIFTNLAPEHLDSHRSL